MQCLMNDDVNEPDATYAYFSILRVFLEVLATEMT